MSVANILLNFLDDYLHLLLLYVSALYSTMAKIVNINEHHLQLLVFTFSFCLQEPILYVILYICALHKQDPLLCDWSQCQV